MSRARRKPAKGLIVVDKPSDAPVPMARWGADAGYHPGQCSGKVRVGGRACIYVTPDFPADVARAMLAAQ